MNRFVVRIYVGGGQHFQSLPKSLPGHFRGRNEAWGSIPPPDWRAREVTGSDFWLCHFLARRHFLPCHFRSPPSFRAASHCFCLILTRAQHADALAPQTRICLCGTTRNNPMHSGDALARAQYPSGGARERAKPKMRQNH